jgi:hypothetical protein
MFEIFLIAIGTLLASYLYTKLSFARYKQYAHIPQLPNHLLWGHLKTFGEFTARGIHDRHPGMLLNDLAETCQDLSEFCYLISLPEKEKDTESQQLTDK